MEDPPHVVDKLGHHLKFGMNVDVNATISEDIDVGAITEAFGDNSSEKFIEGTEGDEEDSGGKDEDDEADEKSFQGTGQADE